MQSFIIEIYCNGEKLYPNFHKADVKIPGSKYKIKYGGNCQEFRCVFLCALMK